MGFFDFQGVKIIAELSANHGGNFEHLLRLMTEAKKSGADLVKFQFYKPECLTLKSSREDFRINVDSEWYGYSTLFDLFDKGKFPSEWLSEFVAEAKIQEIEIFPSVFSPSGLDELERYDFPVYKIASPEINYFELLEAVAKTKKPIIISTGIADLQMIDSAIECLRENGASDVLIMKCSTNYPANVADQNLVTLPFLSERYQVPVGFSDHTTSNESAVCATAFGGKMFEKHFCVDNSVGLDGFFSSGVSEFADYVRSVRSAYRALGKVSFDPSPSEEKYRNSKRSLYFARNIDAGEVLARSDVVVIRPGFGLAPSYLNEIIGKRLSVSVAEATPVSFDSILW